MYDRSRHLNKAHWSTVYLGFACYRFTTLLSGRCLLSTGGKMRCRKINAKQLPQSR
ncbi:hypothetical protein KCP70_13550 [Salmonella enterica subsp. enterica]|nr:hypothetical protein KCP70_13550 [Salmonella enterica subsp. enterica]